MRNYTLSTWPSTEHRENAGHGEAGSEGSRNFFHLSKEFLVKLVKMNVVTDVKTSPPTLDDLLLTQFSSCTEISFFC